MPEDFVDEWIRNEDNIAITDGKGNFGLFAFQYKGVYVGHYLFAEARGKAAYELAEDILRKMYEGPAKTVVGFTPKTNRPAAIMSRRLGFKSYDTVDTYQGPCDLFIQTKREFLDGRYL